MATGMWVDAQEKDSGLYRPLFWVSCWFGGNMRHDAVFPVILGVPMLPPVNQTCMYDWQEFSPFIGFPLPTVDTKNPA